MDYKPYSPEWHRKRYLKEALDIRAILSSRAEQAYQEFTRLNDLEHKLCYQQTTD
jgi:hypothetical protein